MITDNDIDRLFKVEKTVPDGASFETTLQSGTSYKRGKIEGITTITGDVFRIQLRENLLNQADFSIILQYLDKKQGRWFKLTRFNGLHPHKNKFPEDNFKRFYAYHIHYAKERYIQAGLREEFYAEPTDKYTTFKGALNLFLQEFNFHETKNNLFGGKF